MFYSLVALAYAETQASVMTLVSLEQSAYVAQQVTQRDGAGLGGVTERAEGKSCRGWGSLEEAEFPPPSCV